MEGLYSGSLEGVGEAFYFITESVKTKCFWQFSWR